MQRHSQYAVLAVIALLALGLGLFTGCNDVQPVSGALTINPAPNMHVESPVPLYVAFRDGSGEWQRLQANSNGGYTAPVSDADGRYTVLMVMDRLTQNSTRTAQGFGEVIVVHGTLRETPVLRYGYGDSNPVDSPYTVSGNISNMPADPSISLEVRMGRYGMWSGYYTAPSFLLYNPPMPGTWDLVAYTRDNRYFAPDAFMIQRNIAMTGNLTRDIDVSTAVKAEYSQVTLTGGEWGNTYAYVEAITANGTELNVSNFYENQNTIPFALLPQAASGDLYRIFGQVTTDNTVAHVTTWRSAPANSTVALPEQFTGVTVDYAGTTPTLDGLDYSSSVYGEAKGYRADFWGLGDDDNWHAWRCFLTAGALQDATSFILPAPEMLPGWDNAWSLPTSSSQERHWRVFAGGGSMSAADFLALHLNGVSQYDILHRDGTALYSAYCQSESNRSALAKHGDQYAPPLPGN